MTTTLPDTLAGYTDAELATFYGACRDDAGEWRSQLEAEMERRDRAERAADVQARAAEVRRRLADPVREDWERAAYAQYLEAERVCNGELVAPGAPVASGWDLWSGPERRAMQWATEELRNYWRDVSPRITVTTYRAQARGEREAYRDDQLDRDEASALRRVPDQGQGAGGSADRRGEHVPGPAARGAAQAGESAGATTRPGGHVRGPDRGGMTVGPLGLALDAARIAERAQRSAKIRQRTEELKAGMPGSTLAVREGSTLAHRAGPPVDGQLVLGFAHAMLAEYASFPSAAALDAVTLWSAHAHIRDDDGRLAFRATPRLLLMSSEPGSGKSRVLELLGRLCPYTYGLDTEPTAAGLAHTLDKEHATALIDEMDVLVGSGKRKEAVRAVINSGYTQNGTVLRMRGSHAERARVFGPMALAGLDVLEKSAGNALDATLDRCVIIRMVKSHGHVADLNAKADRAGALLKGALPAWAQSAMLSRTCPGACTAAWRRYGRPSWRSQTTRAGTGQTGPGPRAPSTARPATSAPTWPARQWTSSRTCSRATMTRSGPKGMTSNGTP